MYKPDGTSKLPKFLQKRRRNQDESTRSNGAKSADPIWLLGLQHFSYNESFLPASPKLRRHSLSSLLPQPQPSSGSVSRLGRTHHENNWPPGFYADFMSRICLTYRSHITPLRDLTLGVLNGEDIGSSPPSQRVLWSPAACWTSDAGWGCMIRTGQSLLANAIMHRHLGRNWRRPQQEPILASDYRRYATYVQILTWFFDSPSPYAPFSVHRMALAGKDLGHDVGQWFGPSTTAAAMKTLVHAYPEAALGVSVATDASIFYSDVLAASHSSVSGPQTRTWGDRAVLVLVVIRLGVDAVNPIYYDSVKAMYTYPQSVGFAGGRPSSSYYFVGSQADDLFYLDPHHVQLAVPLKPPPSWKRDVVDLRTPTSPNYAKHTSVSSSPFQQQCSPSFGFPTTSTSSQLTEPLYQQASSIPVFYASDLDYRCLSSNPQLDELQTHYARSYSYDDLGTFHSTRILKMPLSELDPSMLIGFLCRDEEDWKDFRRRVDEAKCKRMFHVQDEPPTWDAGTEEDSDNTD